MKKQDRTIKNGANTIDKTIKNEPTQATYSRVGVPGIRGSSEAATISLPLLVFGMVCACSPCLVLVWWLLALCLLLCQGLVWCLLAFLLGLWYGACLFVFLSFGVV